MAIPFDWTIFAGEIGKTSERIGAGVAQRGIDKRAEERAYRMHEMKLKIEQPFKDLENEQLLERQKKLAKEKQRLDKVWLEVETKFKADLNAAYGDPSYQALAKKSLGDFNLQTQILVWQDEAAAVIRGEKEFDIDKFAGAPPYFKRKVSEIAYERFIKREEIRQAQERIDNTAVALRNETDARAERGRGLVDVKRGLDITTKLETNIEDAEEELGDYFSKLMNELAGAKKGSKKFIDKKGRLEVTGRNKDVLFDPETGGFNPETLEKLYKKYPQYKQRFDRLLKLQGNVMKHQVIKEQFSAGEPTEETVPEEWIKTAMEREGLTREQAIAAYKRFKRK